MVIRQNDRYTVDSVAAELKQLLKEDIPQEFKDWARDGIAYVERNPEAAVMDSRTTFSAISEKPLCLQR